MGIFSNFVTLLWPWPWSNLYQKLMVTIPPGGATFCKFWERFDQNWDQDRVSKNRRHTNIVTYIVTYIVRYKQTRLTNILRKKFFFRSNKWPQASNFEKNMPSCPCISWKPRSRSYKMIEHNIPGGKPLPLTPIVSYLPLIPISNFYIHEFHDFAYMTLTQG